MLKSIKKIFNILIGILAVLVLSITMLFFVVRIPSVQTYIVKKITSFISYQTKSTVSIGHVKFTFFNKIEISEILIKDQLNDTILSASSITAGIRQFSRKNNVFKLGKVVVIKPFVRFNTDSTGLMNLNWYLNMLRNPGKSKSGKNIYFHINQVDISDGRFSHINKYASRTKTPFDVNNLRITGINTIVENLDYLNDSVKLDIYNLSCTESTGFILKKLSSNMVVYKQKIQFRDASIFCDSSIINAVRVGILADSSASFQRFTQEVKLDISLKKSLISSNDLKYFVGFLKDYNESVWLSGDVKGTVSELKGRHINVTYKNETSLDCDFDFSGLPDIERTYMFIDVNDFRSISKDIEQIKIPGNGKIVLPDQLRKLGVVTVSGKFTGFTTDFVTYGKIKTNNGIISTDLSLRPSLSGGYNVKGSIRGSAIDLGIITDKPKLLGRLSMEANIDGTASSLKKFALNLTAKIDTVEVNNYKYRNIALKGLFTDKAWDGNIKIEDENVHMELLGMFDFSGKLPEFDFTMNLLKANLYKLNIDKSDSSSSVTLLLTANFRGNSIDNLDGEIKLLNSNIRKHGNSLDIYDFSVKTFTKNNLPSISVRTDFIDANLYGRYNFAGISSIIKSKLTSLMPSKFEKPKTAGKWKDNNFTFDIRFKNSDKFNKFFNTGITLSDSSSIQGSFFPDSIISLLGTARIFSINNNIFNNLSINGNIGDTVSKIIVKSSSFYFAGLYQLKDLNISLSTVPDKFLFKLDWDNKEKNINKGTFIADGAYEKKSIPQKNAVLRIGLKPAEVYVRDNLWKITPSVILIDSNSIKIEKLGVLSDQNYFLIDGAISMNPSDTLQMEFNGININPLNILYDRRMGNDPNQIRLALGGILNGKIRLTDVYKNFMFESDIRVKDFTILGGHFGDIKISSVWNSRKRVADITASNNFEGRKMFDISGFFDPLTSNADLTAKAEKLPVDILNPLLKVFASGITGTASGTVNFFGNFNKPVLTGALMGENVALKIDYLQTRYTFNDSIRFDNTGIKFNNIQSFDDKRNVSYINGAVYHKYFKDFIVDLTITIPPTNDIMILNTRSKDNDLFYGTAYGSGVTTIKSSSSGLSFEISAKTGKNTKFFIPLNKASSVSDRSFINFVDIKKEKNGSGIGFAPKSVSSNKSRAAFDMNFDLEVNPDAEVRIIFDAKAGDEMKGTGTGNLNLNLNKKGEFKINGDYFIENGEYLFTLGGLLLNKRFVVQNGGKISFNGFIQDAEIDIKAIYKIKASLSDIMAGTIDDPKLKEKIWVECQLNLSGNLFNPVVGLDIYLPTADEQTRAYLRSMINSDEEMSRQFFFLLVMNQFYAEQSIQNNSQSTANMGSATVGVTTTEMLSNQVSNWLSQISKDVDIRAAYRPGSNAIPNSQEVELALSTQILNDRVVINGNFGYGGNQSTISSATGNTPLSGAFDIDIKILKNSEKLRFKVFNRSNDNFYFDNGVQYTQGVGLFFRQDFNKLNDIFRKREKSAMKKEEDTKIKNK
jgi:hypothetical protein